MNWAFAGIERAPSSAQPALARTFLTSLWRTAGLAVSTALVGCAGAQIKHAAAKAFDVKDILSQVDQAVQAATQDPKNQTLPPVTSVTLDLQVSVDHEFAATLPVAFVAASPDVAKESVHHIVLNFVPAGAAMGPSQPPLAVDKKAKQAKDSPLATAIRGVYKMMAQQTDSYRVRSGSMSVQCTFKEDAQLGADKINLIPIQLGAEAGKELVQTLTLNFGSDPSASGPGADRGAGDGSGAAPSSGHSAEHSSGHGAQGHQSLLGKKTSSVDN